MNGDATAIDVVPAKMSSGFDRSKIRSSPPFRGEGRLASGHARPSRPAGVRLHVAMTYSPLKSNTMRRALRDRELLETDIPVQVLARSHA